jgi:hypothetical protein
MSEELAESVATLIFQEAQHRRSENCLCCKLSSLPAIKEAMNRIVRSEAERFLPLMAQNEKN